MPSKSWKNRLPLKFLSVIESLSIALGSKWKINKSTGKTCFYQVRTPQIQLWRITQIWIKTLPLKFLIGDLALERNLVGFLPAQMDNYFISTCKSRFLNTTFSKLRILEWVQYLDFRLSIQIKYNFDQCLHNFDANMGTQTSL